MDLHISEQTTDYWKMSLLSAAEEIYSVRRRERDVGVRSLDDSFQEALRSEAAKLAGLIDGLGTSRIEVASFDAGSGGNPPDVVAKLFAGVSICSSIDAVIQAHPLFVTPGSAQASAAATASPSSIFQRALDAFAKAVRGIASWLVTLLQTATKLKSWKISGDLGNTTWGLAAAKLEITFGS